MGVKRRVPITQINNPGVGATATLSLDTGPIRYHKLMIGYKTATVGGATEATMASEITAVRIKINGVVQRECTPQELFDLNRQKGKTPTVSVSTTIPGYLTIYFAEPQCKSQIERDLLAWGMLGVGKLTVELDIASGAGTSTITGWAEVDDEPVGPGRIVKLKKQTLTINGTGDNTFQLDTERGDSYRSVTFKEASAGDIDGIEIKWDGLQIYKDDENVAVEYLNSGDYTKVSKYRHVPLSHNDLNRLVPTRKKGPNGQILKVGSMPVTLTMGAAANVVQLAEVLGAPD